MYGNNGLSHTPCVKDTTCIDQKLNLHVIISNFLIYEYIWMQRHLSDPTM